MDRSSYFFLVESGDAIVLSDDIVPMLSAILFSVPIEDEDSSAFLPQLTTARATVVASTTTIASANSLRIEINFTSSQSRRAGKPGRGQ